MINIKISTKNASVVFVSVEGHSGFAQEGQDIVCAGVSSIVQSTLLGLLEVVKLNLDYTRKDALLKFALPQNLTVEQRHDADVLLNSMVLSLKDFAEGYKKFIKLEVS